MCACQVRLSINHVTLAWQSDSKSQKDLTMPRKSTKFPRPPHFQMVWEWDLRIAMSQTGNFDLSVIHHIEHLENPHYSCILVSISKLLRGWGSATHKTHGGLGEDWTSGYGLGAMLLQAWDQEREAVVAYVSQALTKSERRYCVTCRELLAVMFALQQFWPYLLGRPFILCSDHGSLIWLHNFREPEGQ